MIMPSEALLYVYYRCSKCGNLHPEFRPGELKVSRLLVCDVCGHTDRTEPLQSITVKFKKQGISKESTSTHRDINDILESLEFAGYTRRRCKIIARQILSKSPGLSDDELLAKIIEHHEQTKT